ncbi:MAG: cysteine synthase family protein [Waddliaceae bacterium]
MIQHDTSRTILDAIGWTPLVELQRLNPYRKHKLLVKLEFLNPGFSIKDRIVKHIIDHAEKTGQLKPGGTIVENTSGNTGAAIAMIAAIRGYKAILTLPDKVSQEKQNALKAYGAKIIVTPTDVPADSPDHYVNRAKKIAAETPNCLYLDQYNNPKNTEAHYLTTGPEIWRQTQGKVDYFVASASTGGTISGAGRYLKEQNSRIQVVMPDPVGSIYYEYFKTKRIPETGHCRYQLEGIGENHLAKAIDFSVIDDVMQVTDRDSFAMARQLAQQEGILAGGSSGANVWAALELAKFTTEPSTIVTVIPDGGIKYLSKIYDDAWMHAHRLL